MDRHGVLGKGIFVMLSLVHAAASILLSNVVLQPLSDRYMYSRAFLHAMQTFCESKAQIAVIAGTIVRWGVQLGAACLAVPSRMLWSYML